MSDDKLHFRALTTANLRDLAALRRNDEALATCSCMKWRMTSTAFFQSTKKDRARAFDSRVTAGAPVGILAYVEGVPVGWCSIAPHHSFAGLSSSEADEDARLWCVTCLYVSPGSRGTGIGLRLLRAAVQYARAEGAHVIEGYPAEPRNRSLPEAGSASMFRQAGFRDAPSAGARWHVMRNVVG